MNTMHVEDFVVLGRTVPEESKKYGQRICMAGYSAENNQFLRVYPLLVPVGDASGANGFRARYRYVVDLRRNSQDTRTESWRVEDETKPTQTPWPQALEVSKADVLTWLEKRVVPSIQVLNQCRLSLGVLRLPADKWEGLSIARDATEEPEHHATLFEDLEEQATYTSQAPLISRVRFAPYLRFTDEAGEHRLQVREWGAYLLLGNPQYADAPDALWGASGYRRGKDLFVVVGNMNNHRRNWLVIKTFEADAPKQPSLYDMLDEGDQD